MKVNVVIVGHVDHGKSTLIGRLLYDSNSITEGRVEEIQKLAEVYKKRFEFAYFIDSFDDELIEERTIDTTGVMFKGRNLYAISDVPGHKEFIKNMLTGASHADAAVLVVSATEGVQEQTRRHAFLIHMLGIKHIFAVVNKMDAVSYRQEVFREKKDEVSRLLSSLGSQAKEVIPCSAMEGDNIYTHSSRMMWYQGHTLIEALDNLEIVREATPLRFVVQDNYKIDSKEVVVGRVESGTLKKGDRVVFQPSATEGHIEQVLVWGQELESAEAGDSIGIVTSAQPQRGDVMGLAQDPPATTSQFLGEVVLLDNILKQKDTVEVSCGTKRIHAEVKQIREKINSETGEVMERNPVFIKENDAATILFSTEPIVVEKFSEIPQLGRFILVRGKNIGAGIVLEKRA